MDAHVALEGSTASPVEDIAGSRFAFTDPRGRVTRWGTGAGVLFGVPAEQIVGQQLFEVALAGADGGWSSFLRGEREECPSSALEVSVTRTDGQVFPCVVNLVPVLLADGLDFSQFAGDLAGDHDSLDAFRRRHQRVLGMIESAVRKGARYAEGERLAGMIATFRPLGDVPVTNGARSGEARDHAQRAEREDLHDPLSNVGAEFAELRTRFDSLRDRVEAFEIRAGADLDTLAASINASLGERIDALENRSPPAVDTAALAREVERSLSGRLERAIEGRVEEVVAVRIEEALPGRVEEAVAGRVEEAVAGRIEAAAETVPDEVLAKRVKEAVARQVEEAVARQVEEAVAYAVEEAVARRVEAAVTGRVEEALGEARDAMQRVAQELRVGSTSGARPLPIGFNAGEDDPAVIERPALSGFDEVDSPLARLSLDGRFRYLNRAFRDLVGYTEEEFGSARWPSPLAPEQVESHRELKRALVAGELAAASIETAYMHREGLLVPLAGRMSLERDADGAPHHLLFSVGTP